LTARWNSIKSFNEDGEVTEEELFSQQMVCILSREYVAFLSQLIIKTNFIAKEDSKKPPSEILTALAFELLKNKVSLVIIKSIISFRLSWNPLLRLLVC
jgi:hypothetical protein